MRELIIIGFILALSSCTKTNMPTQNQLSPKEIISGVRIHGLDEEIIAKIKFNPAGKKGEIGASDQNREVRQAVIEELTDFTIMDIELIRFLTKEELKATQYDHTHEGLSQVCSYLYLLGNVEDVFLIFDCKYASGSMDAGIMVDREMLKLVNDKDDMTTYLKSVNAENDLINVIIDSYDNPDYSSREKYKAHIKQYYGIK